MSTIETDYWKSNQTQSEGPMFLSKLEFILHMTEVEEILLKYHNVLRKMIEVGFPNPYNNNETMNNSLRLS